MRIQLQSGKVLYQSVSNLSDYAVQASGMRVISRIRIDLHIHTNPATRTGTTTSTAVQKYIPASSLDQASSASPISVHTAALKTSLLIMHSRIGSPSSYLAAMFSPHHFLASGVTCTIVEPLIAIFSGGNPSWVSRSGTSRARPLEVQLLPAEFSFARVIPTFAQ